MEIFFNSKIYQTDKSSWTDWFITFINENFDKIVSGELDITIDPSTGLERRRGMTVDWSLATLKKNGVISLCVSTVPLLINILEKYPFLLNTKMASEVEHKAQVLENDYITGKFDFIIEDNEISILDGKSNKDPKDAKRTQLMYYALVYYLCKGKLPDTLGFIFWRYANLETFKPSEEDLLNLKKDIEDVITAIKNSEFVATPSESACQWCKFNLECRERISFRAHKKSAKSTGIFDFIEDGDHTSVMF
jgi:CRISPR/Cas system-associated exonuclease Cas4 (RecB family)